MNSSTPSQNRCERIIFSTETHKMRCERNAKFRVDDGYGGKNFCTQHSKMIQAKLWKRANKWVDRIAIGGSK